MNKRKYFLTVPFIVLPLVASLIAAPSGATSVQPATAKPANVTGVSLRLASSYDTLAGVGGAEISAMDAKSKRLFITNGAKNTIDIVDISDIKSRNW